MSDSSRFDPERVEWPGRFTVPGPLTAIDAADYVSSNIKVLPATTYRELYEAAEELAVCLKWYSVDYGQPLGLGERSQAALEAFTGEPVRPVNQWWEGSVVDRGETEG